MSRLLKNFFRHPDGSDHVFNPLQKVRMVLIGRNNIRHPVEPFNTDSLADRQKEAGRLGRLKLI
jgi:hypothetical protein